MRPAAEVGAIVRACAGALLDVGAVEGLVLGEPAWLGGRPPRVLAVAIGDPDGELRGVQSRVARALAAIGAYVPEARPFRPHVTVCRVRRGARVDRRGLGELDPPPPLRFGGGAVVLMRSHLGGGGGGGGGGGARYEPLAEVPLAGTG